MNFSPKLISVLSLLQFFFVAAGCLFTRSCLKFYDPAMRLGLSFGSPTLPLFVRAYGLWFLLVPVVWACVATIRGHAAGGIAFISSGQFIIGTVLTAVLAVVFLLSAYRAMMLLGN